MSPPPPLLALTVRPRLQRETWSLYWREAMATETACAADVTIALAPAPAGGDAADAPSPPPPLPATATVRDALRAAAAACGWPPVGSLVRLEGFEGPFERCLCRGVEVGMDEPAGKYAAAAAGGGGGGGSGGGGGPAAGADGSSAAAAIAPLVYVRTVLAAEGWRLANDPGNDPAGYSTSDSDDD